MSVNNRDQPDFPPDIATPDEVLKTFTQIMRGTMTETATRKSAHGEEAVQQPPKISERSKAAEMLGKRYGLFSEKEQAVQPKDEIVQQIESALKKIMEDACGSSGA